MRNISLTTISKKITFILLCVLLCDCCIFASGRLIEFGTIGFRTMLCGIIIIVAVPVMCDRFIELVKNKYFIAVFLFAIWVFVSFVIGILNNNQMNMIDSDIRGYMYFAILPIAICVLDDDDAICQVMRVMLYSSVFLSVCIVIITIVYISDRTVFDLITAHLTQKQMVIFASVFPKLPRLFFRNIMYQICGCAFATYFQIEEKKLSIKYILSVGLCFFGIFMTYTRSVYLGTGIAAVMMVLYFFRQTDAKEKKRMYQHILGSVTVLALILGAFSVTTGTNYAKFAVERTFAGIINFEDLKWGQNDDVVVEENVIVQDAVPEDFYIQMTIESDKMRQTTLDELYSNIVNSPIIGNGLGKALKCRYGGYHEYFYLDVLSKCGIVGLVLYMMPLFMMLYDLHKRKEEKNKLDWTILAVLIGFMIFSWFNPYMNTSLGIIYYCCVLGAFSRHKLTITERKRNGTK